MTKIQELAIHDSCWNKAKHDEPIFVLLARDAASPVAILQWIEERVNTGKNRRSDKQIVEALGLCN